MSTESKDAAGKLPPPPASTDTAQAPFLSPWLAFAAAGFCFIAGGFRLTADERLCYESMNVELPYVLEFQVEWGAKLGLALMAVGVAFMLLTRWTPRMTTPARKGVISAARLLTALGAVGAVLVSIGILRSGELIFETLQTSLAQ